VVSELATGGIITLDAFGMPSLNGRRFSPQTYRFLSSRKLLRVLNPDRKSSASGNGYVLSELGQQLANANSGILNSAPAASQRRAAEAIGLSFPDDVTQAELYSLVAAHRASEADAHDLGTAAWFVRSVLRYLELSSDSISEESIHRYASAILADRKLWTSLKQKYLMRDCLWVGEFSAPITFGDGYGETSSKRTAVFKTVVNWLQGGH
jgi:hypothetical protein